MDLEPLVYDNNQQHGILKGGINGWVADDVVPFFPKPTPIVPFTWAIPDGEEE